MQTKIDIERRNRRRDHQRRECETVPPEGSEIVADDVAEQRRDRRERDHEGDGEAEREDGRVGEGERVPRLPEREERRRAERRDREKE